jgi:choline dehydrogenase-like flavoprotein
VTYTGGIVVVSCGAANSAKLLLLSANDKHPNGLANGSDQVGRNYMFHNSAAVLAISREPNPTKYQKTLGLNDFYFGMDGFPYPMGNIQMVGKSQGPMYKGEKPIEAGLAPAWTLDRLARHAVDFWLSTEDLPWPDNRITIDGDGTIKLSYTLNNQVPKQRLYEKLKSMLDHLGMDPHHLIPRNLYMKNEIGIGGVAHQAGTCRFGTDPKTSVLDTSCKAHQLDNLYVVDTSFFPTRARRLAGHAHQTCGAQRRPESAATMMTLRQRYAAPHPDRPVLASGGDGARPGVECKPPRSQPRWAGPRKWRGIGRSMTR